MAQNMTKKQRMEQYKNQVEKHVVFRDNITGHVFTRGPLLGKGGFGFVYVTTMPGYSRRMVLKAIPTARITKPSQRQRIHTEVSLHKSLKHENVAKLYHSFEEDHVICMVIERCERSLLDLLSSQNRRVKIEDCSVVIRQVLMALNYLHSKQIIHRDIKLGNVLLKQDLVVKLIDFGLAKEYNPSDKPTICGTPNYLAPEVLSHKGHKPVSDIWSVGCVLVVLLSGHAPFEGETTDETYDMIINNEPKLPDHIPEFVTNFIKCTLEKDHNSRITGTELLRHNYIYKYQNVPARTSGPMDNRTPNKLKNTDEEPTSLLNYIDTIPSKNAKIVLKDCGNSESSNEYLWVQCWIDYTNKDCGFAYRISNDTVGVKLKVNKISYIVKRNINRRNEDMRYEYYSESRNKLIEFRGNNHMDVKFDDRFKRHVDEMKHLVDYYDEYMSAHLINNNNNHKKSDENKHSTQIKLLDWTKNKTYVAMALTNYTIQVNFFLTHFKVIIQGQFNSEDKVPWLPTSPLGRKTANMDDLSVISLNESDVPQPFKIIFINNKRMSYELNPAVVLPLLKYGPVRFSELWAGDDSSNGSSNNAHWNINTPLHGEVAPTAYVNLPQQSPTYNVNKSFQLAIGATLDELYNTLIKAHKAMHQLTVFSKNCYFESPICQACHDNTEEVVTKMNPNCLPKEAQLDGNGSPCSWSKNLGQGVGGSTEKLIQNLALSPHNNHGSSSKHIGHGNCCSMPLQPITHQSQNQYHHNHAHAQCNSTVINKTHAQHGHGLSHGHTYTQTKKTEPLPGFVTPQHNHKYESTQALQANKENVNQGRVH